MKNLLFSLFSNQIHLFISLFCNIKPGVNPAANEGPRHDDAVVSHWPTNRTKFVSNARIESLFLEGRPPWRLPPRIT